MNQGGCLVVVWWLLHAYYHRLLTHPLLCTSFWTLNLFLCSSNLFCQCRRGTYYQETNQDNTTLTCVACPDGADCSAKVQRSTCVLMIVGGSYSHSTCVLHAANI
jgi:hypothetical protein